MSSRLSIVEMASILRPALNHLVDTNDPPSELEVVKVHTLLQELQTRVAEFPCYASVLDSEKQDLQRCISQHRAILSPVRYIPPEVIMQIFAYTSDGSFDVLRVDAGPWVLTHVCRSWRAVALACPELWTTLTLPWERLEARIDGSYLLLDNVLKRSTNRLLNFTFTPEKATSAAEFYYRRLFKEAGRWKSARLYVPDNVYACFLDPQLSLPHLETLDVVVDLNRVLKESPTLFAACESAPLLHDVSISGTAPLSARHLLNVHLPWKQLKRFCTEHIHSIDHLIELLTNVPDLDHLDLLCLQWHYPKYDESYSVHETVRSLRLWDPRLLDYLVLPSLESLELELDTKDKFASALGRFTHRSQCSPRKLSLTNGRPSERLEALRSVPTLEHLVIDEPFYGSKYVDSLFRMLTWGPGEAILPRMEHFEWRADLASFQFDGDSLLDMVESRWRVADGPVVTRLKSVRVACRAWRSKPRESVRRRVAQLKKEGLDIHVSFNA